MRDKVRSQLYTLVYCNVLQSCQFVMWLTLPCPEATATNLNSLFLPPRRKKLSIDRGLLRLRGACVLIYFSLRCKFVLYSKDQYSTRHNLEIFQFFRLSPLDFSRKVYRLHSTNDPALGCRCLYIRFNQLAHSAEHNFVAFLGFMYCSGC